MNIIELAESAQDASIEAHKLDNGFHCLMQAILHGDYDAKAYDWYMTDLAVRLGKLARATTEICEEAYAICRESKEVPA